ncbi:MAG: 30S ribosomal protein S3ae [Nitrososphaeria archaeon]|nr:30S ribosomal protein S3ae [Nitrososphaeria archaeon]
MPKKKRRRTVKKREKKRLYTVTAPPSLGGMELLEVMAKEDESLINKTYRPLLYDISEDLQHQNMVLKLKINRVEGEKAQTIYFGHEYVREYLRALMIRGTSYVEATRDVETKDGFLYRAMVGSFTSRRINTSRKKAIRKIIFDVLEKRASELDNDSFIKEMLFGKIASEVYNMAKKICPLRHVGIIKQRLLAGPALGEEAVHEEGPSPSRG